MSQEQIAFINDKLDAIFNKVDGVETDVKGLKEDFHCLDKKILSMENRKLQCMNDFDVRYVAIKDFNSMYNNKEKTKKRDSFIRCKDWIWIAYMLILLVITVVNVII